MSKYSEVLNSQGVLNALQIVTGSPALAQKCARIAISECRKNRDLAACDGYAIAACVMAASQMGLEIGADRGHAYLFKDKNGPVLRIGYKGYIALALRNPRVSHIDVQAVYDGDHFEVVLGSTPKIIHRPSMNAAQKTDKNLTHVYAVVHFADAEPMVEWMTRAEVEKAKAVSKSGAVWGAWYTEQARKTVVRRLCKRLQYSPELAMAGAVDESQMDAATLERLVGESVASAVAQHIPAAVEYSRAEEVAQRMAALQPETVTA